MQKFTELDYFAAIDKWLKDNQPLTINDMPKRTIVVIDGKEIRIGHKLSLVRTNNCVVSGECINRLKNEYHFDFNQKFNRLKDEDFFKAIDIWLRENPEKTINDITKTTVVLLDDRQIGVGAKLSAIRCGIRKISDETKNILVNKYNFNLVPNDKVVEQDYFDAIDIWLRENPGKTVNDINKYVVVEVNKKMIYLGVKLSRIRNLGENDSKSKKKHGAFSKEGIERLINQYGFIQESKSNIRSDSEYIEIIEQWLSEHPGATVNDIKSTDVIIYKGRPCNIGSRVFTLRSKREEGKLSSNVEKVLVEQYGFNKASKKITEQDYFDAFDKWLNDNPGKTINDITFYTYVIINDKKIHVGQKLSDIKRDKSLFSKEGMYKLFNEYGFEIYKRRLTIKESLLLKYNGDEKKALEKYKLIQSSKEKIRKNRSQVKRKFNLDEILKEFDVNEELLKTYLNRNKDNHSNDEVLMFDEDETLKHYCITRGYDYDKVYRLVKDKVMNPSSNIKEKLSNTCNHDSTYVYTKNGISIKRILLCLGLESNSIIYDMQHSSKTLDEAIIDEVFYLNINDEHKWLYALYNKILFEFELNQNSKEDLLIIMSFYRWIYQLDLEEMQILTNIIMKSLSILREYRKIIFGLTNDQNSLLKLQSIYKFNENEVIESKVLSYLVKSNIVGETELYLKKQLLCNYIKAINSTKTISLSDYLNNDILSKEDAIFVNNEIKR